MGKITIIGLVLFCSIIMAPPIIYGYVYPNIGDDTAVTLGVFDSIQKNGVPVGARYLAYSVVGYPLVFISDILGMTVDKLYVWFSFMAFAASGVVIYFVFSRLANRTIGWLALLLSIFCAQGFMYLFYYGQLFNIINIGIILPLLLFFTVGYVSQKRYFAGVIICAILFAGFHTSGIYLPAVAGVATAVYIIYAWVRKRPIQKRVVLLGSSIVFGGLVIFGFLVLWPTIVVSGYARVEDYDFMESLGGAAGFPIGHYLVDIFSPSLLVLLALAVLYSKEALIAANSTTKALMAVLGSVVVVLAIGAFARVSLDPFRQAIDFAAVYAMFLAVLLGLVAVWKYKFVILILLVAVSFGLIHNLPTWFNYNSAVRPVDLQALAYADNFETFSCSAEVAPWVYERFTSAKHVDNEGELVIMRSKSMTPRSDKDNMWYQGHGWTPDNSYELTKTYSDGKVGIEIYEVMEQYK